MNDLEKDAVTKWYHQDWIIETAKRLKAGEKWDDLEAHVQKHALMPVSKHDDLPDYMRTEDGKPLFPTNLSPINDEEIWQDAIEIGWEVIKEKVGISMDHVQAKIREEIDADWDVFIKSVEERKKTGKDPKE